MPLKLLVFVPTHTDAVDIHHELTTQLVKHLATKADVVLSTSEDKNVMSSIDTFDILHIFGSWSHSACQLAAKAYRQRVPYLVTPLGGLQPWEMEHHNYSLLAKELQSLIRRAAAVHVCGKLEEQTFAKLAWNRRTALIKNPVLTSQITFEQATESLMKLYRKVIDSNVRLLFKDDVRQLIGQLLQIGIDPKAEILRDSEGLRGKLKNMTQEDWRRVFIYADDEHIFEPLAKAMNGLGLRDSVVDVSGISRFESNRNYTEGHLKDEALLSRSLLLRNKVKEIFDEHQRTEQTVCLALLNLYYEISHHTAPLLHLADFYTVLRFTDMDEDAVREMADRLKLGDFSCELMGVMGDFLGLTEGFMPFKAVHDKATQRLYTSITKFGAYI